jgi:hypothetical protein
MHIVHEPNLLGPRRINVLARVGEFRDMSGRVRERVDLRWGWPRSELLGRLTCLPSRLPARRLRSQDRSAATWLADAVDQYGKMIRRRFVTYWN